MLIPKQHFTASSVNKKFENVQNQRKGWSAIETGNEVKKKILWIFVFEDLAVEYYF